MTYVRRLALVGGALIGLTGLATGVMTGTSAMAVGKTEAVIEPAPADGSPTDQVIVTFASQDTQLNATQIRSAAGTGARSVRKFIARSQVVRLPKAMSGAELEATMQSLGQQPGVVNVAPDPILHSFTNDTDYSQQWDLAAPTVGGPMGIDVEGAWALTKGSNTVNVAVIDTGYIDHADLKGRFIDGYDFIDEAVVANDGDGRDADAHDPGDWVTPEEGASGDYPDCPLGKPSSWHGSHVAGTIGALTDNNLGIAGINSTSPIVPVRVLGKCGGGYFTDIVDGMIWASGGEVDGVPINKNPAKVISMSLGGPLDCKKALWGAFQGVVDQITARGSLIVASAGNEKADVSTSFPANCDGVLAVAATSDTGNLASYSNYGALIDVAAPGGDKGDGKDARILSTVNKGTEGPLPSPGGDDYQLHAGTSMAAPHVSGVVSLMLSVNPALTPAELIKIVGQTATPFPTGSTCVGKCGPGILNAKAAVAAALAAVPPPTTTTAPTTTAPTTTAPTTTAPTTTAPTTTAPTTTAPTTTVATTTTTTLAKPITTTTTVPTPTTTVAPTTTPIPVSTLPPVDQLPATE